MTSFTPLASLAGGALIGLSAVLLMLFSSRIAGITGIVRRLLPLYAASKPLEAAAFVAGLVVAPLLWPLLTGRAVEQSVSENIPVLVTAGLLVGFGSIWGNGCTSGHGVCGLSRLSPRSVAATAVFMTVAIVTVYVTRHILGGV